jgi:PAS domain S-box-containing protein
MAIWSVDAGGQVDVSPEFRRLLKLPEERQPTLEELLSRYYPGELERVQRLIEQALADGQKHAEWEYRHLWPSGEVRWFLVRAEFLSQEDGSPAGSIGVIVDVTDRKKADEHRERIEAELRESESRLRIAQSAGKVGSFELFPNTRRIRVSEEFCRLWGVTPLQEAPVSFFLDNVHPEDREDLRTGEARLPQDALDYREYRIIRRDTGETRWLARRGEAIKDMVGGGLRYFGVCYDITDQVAHERRQRLLLTLSDEMRRLATPTDIVRAAQRMLGEHLGANRVGYGEVDASERYFTTVDNWTNGVPSRHGTHDLAGFGSAVHSALKRGEPLIIQDVQTDPRTRDSASVAAFEAIDAQSAITASLVISGKMVAALYVHAQTPRMWSAADAQLVQDVAERTWAELARARAERLARASEERFRRIFEQTNDPIITADLNQVITDVNPAAAEAVGTSREEAIGRPISDFVSPEDFGHTSAMLQQKMERGGTTRYDVRVHGASGRLLFWEVNSGLTFDELARPVGLHVVARDVTERKRWERHQALLVAELNHRVKNTLAVVQSLAHQTFKRTANPAEAITAYEGRLNALAAAHNLLTNENWESAEIQDVLTQALRPFGPPTRWHLDGPSRRVDPRIAVSLTLAVHELATNAVKYGALSNGTGEIQVSWDEIDGGIEIVWRETGGPPVKTPEREGFGSQMLRRVLAQDLDGTVAMDFGESGLVCRIKASFQIEAPRLERPAG